jgi:hypothetical protein
MALIVCDTGALAFLDSLRTIWNTSGTRTFLRLYRNDYIPVVGSVLANFSEANFPGYAAFTTNGNKWGAPVLQAGRATTQFPPVTWTMNAATGGNQIYGYYVTGGGGTGVVWAERDPGAPIPMTAVGHTYTIAALFTLKSEFM